MYTWRKAKNIGGNVNLYNNMKMLCGVSSVKLKVKLPYDPAILLMDICAKRLKCKKKISVLPCSLQHYSQKPSYKINLNVY
jgi:hypothetical protein